jgi:hypothetical protein
MVVNSGKQSPRRGRKLPRNLFEAAAFTLLEEISFHLASLRRGGLFSLVLSLSGGYASAKVGRCAAPRRKQAHLSRLMRLPSNVTARGRHRSRRSIGNPELVAVKSRSRSPLRAVCLPGRSQLGALLFHQTHHVELTEFGRVAAAARARPAVARWAFLKPARIGGYHFRCFTLIRPHPVMAPMRRLPRSSPG